MHFVRMSLIIKDLLKSLENSCNFISWNPLSELIEVLQPHRHIFGDEFWSFPQIFNSFNTHIIELFCFFRPNPPNFLQLLTNIVLLLNCKSIQSG